MSHSESVKTDFNPVSLRITEIYLFLLTLVMVCCSGEARSQKKWQKESISIPPVICHTSGETGHSYVPPPEGFLKRLKSGKKTSDIVLRYVNVPDSAKAAFEYAAGIWEYLLSSPIPIYMQISWEVLSKTTLGSCGPANYFHNFEGAPMKDTYYPVAVVEKITGKEITGPGVPDMTASFNSTIPWYVGTDGKTPFDRYDLVFIVLHEFAHGLGFDGFFQVNTTQRTASYGFSDQLPTAYDRYLENFNASRLTDVTAFRNPSNELYKAVTSGQLFSGSPVAYQWGQSKRPKLYAPVIYSSGSSIYHLDDNTYVYGDVNALMTSAAGKGEAIHSPGPLASGILADLGWKHLYIRYIPIKDVEEISGPLVFNASFTSDLGIKDKSVKLVYSNDNFLTSRDSVYFEPVDQNGNYSASINPVSNHVKISYFLTAKDTLGRKFFAPYTYPDSVYTVILGPDTLKPVIIYQPLKFILSSLKDFEIAAKVTDNLGVDSVVVVFYNQSGQEMSRRKLIKGDGDIYRNQFDVQALGLETLDSVRYSIVAVDIARVPNTSRLPLKGTFAFKIENILSPVNEYSNNFETNQGDWILADFKITKESGFDSYALNSPHPYPSPDRDGDSLVFITILRIPVIVHSNGGMSFDEVVLVEPGEPGAVFGSSDFYDYVIVEGSKDKGKTWLPILDGYDSNSYDTWRTAYNSQISGNNSSTVGSKGLFNTRYINMTGNGNFSAGDTILIRFRLYSDPYGHGWGWLIDNLNIQNPTGTGQISLLSPGQVEIWPNPVSDFLNLKIDRKNSIHNLDIEILDLTGRVLYRNSVMDLTAGQVTAIDIRNIPEGMFVVRLWAEKRPVFSAKVFKTLKR